MRKKLAKLVTGAAARNSSSSGVADVSTPKKIPRAPHVLPPPHSRSSYRHLEKPPRKKFSPSVSKQTLDRLKEVAACKDTTPHRQIPAEDSAPEVISAISSILRGVCGSAIPDDSSTLSPSAPHDRASLKNILGISWFSEGRTAQQRKEVSVDRKQRYIFKNTESHRYKQLVRMCAEKLGTEVTLDFFGKIKSATGTKEYKTLIELCVAKAKQADVDASIVHIREAYQLFLSMRERGFQIKEECSKPFLMYLVDMRMTHEFQIFSEFLKEENSGSFSRIGYYEMLLWIRVGDEAKIRELCNSVGADTTEDSYNLAENYLLAFCDSDRKEELLELLEVLDVRRISSLKYISSIFRSLGRLQLENFAKKFILTFKTGGTEEANVSSFIYDYATSIPNLAVEEIKATVINFHDQLGVLPSIIAYDKLIKLCCSSSKVHCAMDIVDHMCRSCSDVSVESFHPLLHACEQNCEFELVGPIYSMMRRHKLKPKADTFKVMISLCVRMKNFEHAYNLLTDAAEINEVPTASMYNAIMSGYFREKNNQQALMVLKQMDDANVKPDSETYNYLIANCERERDIPKYLDGMRLAGIKLTKHVYMALINAYVKFGNFEMAKQVILDPELPSQWLNDIKSTLVSAFASNGRISDALNVYDNIKQAQCKVEPKAVINLIEHIQFEGALERLLQLLEELKGSSSWFDGCSRVVSYCVRYNITNSAIELLKQLVEIDKQSTDIVIDMIYCEIWKADSINLKTGLELLQAIKEELHFHPSRTSLDFLLSSCAKAKDSVRAWLVWSEYEDAGLPYNVLTFLRMYHALLSSGDHEGASEMLKKLPLDDPHVKLVINSCKMKYCKPSSAKIGVRVEDARSPLLPCSTDKIHS